MNKVVQRLLVFFIGLPLVVCLVWFNQFHHIALHVLVFAASLLAASELYHLFANKFALQARPLPIILTVLPVFTAALCALFELPLFLVDFVFIFAVLLCMAWEVLTSSSFENSVSHLVTSIFIILYAGYLPSFISKMTLHEHSREFIAFFFIMVCMCDSIAWFFGVLFGKNNKGFIKASPNKSVAGFIGGFSGTLFSGFIAYKFFPTVFVGSLCKVLLFSFFVAFVSIIGDLVESVIKRSVEIKDSGSIIPGRGGVLDSVDSLVFVAPVYYFGVNFLF
ncbi:MAG: phosphatidate cytidylyltransferase [Treponema sp.]|nr:phosphatidate cytidylyltransferase [Treponema sp.]